MRAKTILLAFPASQHVGKSHAGEGSQHISQAVTQCESEASLDKVTVYTELTVYAMASVCAGTLLMLSV